MAFHNYLFFSGDCREAFQRYQQIFGGDLVLIKGSDMPSHEQPSPEQADLIMHAALTVGDTMLMASDDIMGGSKHHEGFRVSYSAPDADEARRVFDALAEGGQVAMPLEATSFSPAFGMCSDSFGVPWMISTEVPEED